MLFDGREMLKGEADWPALAHGDAHRLVDFAFEPDEEGDRLELTDRQVARLVIVTSMAAKRCGGPEGDTVEWMVSRNSELADRAPIRACVGLAEFSSAVLRIGLEVDDVTIRKASTLAASTSSIH